MPASMLPLHPARLRPPARCHGWRRPPAGSARRHGAFGDVVRTDLAGSLRLSGKVDLLLFNPPYVATPREEMEGSGISISWAGGVDGRCVRVRPRWGGGGGMRAYVVAFAGRIEPLRCVGRSVAANTGMYGRTRTRRRRRRRRWGQLMGGAAIAPVTSPRLFDAQRGAAYSVRRRCTAAAAVEAARASGRAAAAREYYSYDMIRSRSAAESGGRGARRRRYCGTVPTPSDPHEAFIPLVGAALCGELAERVSLRGLGVGWGGCNCIIV